MTNAQQHDADWTAPLRELIASLRELDARFSNASETIRRIRPDETIGNFPSLEGIETLGPSDLGIREVFAKLAVHAVERRADELLAEEEEAERVRAETLRRQNQSPLEATIEKLERVVAYQGAEIAKLKGTQTGRLPALPHVPGAEVPQFQGMPGGMGRHGVIGAPGGSGGARKIGAGVSVSAPDTAGNGFTRWPHPLDMIGGGGKR